MSAIRSPDARAGALPPGGDPRVFDAPWQAQAFAMTVALNERGHFTWAEWTTALSRTIAGAQVTGDQDGGDAYWNHWLAALEQLLLDKGLAQPLALTALRQAWRVAAESTPHGQPVVLGAAARARARGFRRDER